MCVRMYVRMYACMYVCVCMYVLVYACVHMGMCVHTTVYEQIRQYVHYVCLRHIYIYIYIERERETERERERNNVHDFVCILCTSASIHVCHHVEYTNGGSVSRGGANFLKDLPVGNPASCNPHLQIGTDYCQHQTGARPHDKLRHTALGLLRLNI